jgi:hypothetical protein
MPTSWVLDDFAVDRPAPARAWQELQKRVAAKQLNSAQLAELTRREIDWQLRFPTGWGKVNPTADLVDKAAKGLLSQVDADRFFAAQKLVLHTAARPVIGPDEPIMYELWFDTQSSVPFVTDHVEFWIDDQKVDQLPSPYGLWQHSQFGALTKAPSPPICPGKHKFRAIAKVSVEPSFKMGPFVSVNHNGNSFVVEASQDMEVLSGPSVRIVSTADLRGKPTVEIINYGPPTRGPAVDCWLTLPPHDVTVAGMVSMQIDGKEFSLGGALIRPGETQFIAAGRTPSVLPDSVDVILRSDPLLALRTFDVREVWGGEIHFPHVPVRHTADGGGRVMGGSISPVAMPPRP